MARFPRLLVSNTPHHITQRGNRRQQTFFCDEDYVFYLRILDEVCKCFDVSIDAYCLMPNHVHLVLTPKIGERLREAMVETHSAYTRRINTKMGWKGYLWQGRFFSCPMDEWHFRAAIPYVEYNPVEARMVSKAEDFPWSSARARILKATDPHVTLNLGAAFSHLDDLSFEDAKKVLEYSTRTGRPAGSDSFIKSLEKISGRILAKQKPGPKPAQ